MDGLWPLMRRLKRESSPAGIKSIEEYRQWQKTQNDMPPYPNITYKKRGWQSWMAFLGTKQLNLKTFASYEEAKKRVQAAGIKSIKEYVKWQKNHKNMPSTPSVTYRNQGWINWGEFLGTGRTKDKFFISYEEAKKRIRAERITSVREYQKWQKDHPDIPSNPHLNYKDKGWVSWRDFLGTNKKRGKPFALL